MIHWGRKRPLFFMIDKDTPYKMAEIIRDTWPNLFRPSVENIKNVEEELPGIDTDENA